MKPQTDCQRVQKTPTASSSEYKEAIVEKIRVLQRLVSGYPRTTFSENNLAIFAEGLVDLDTSLLNETIGRLLHNEEFCPSIAKIRSTYREVKSEKRYQEKKEQRLLPEAPISDKERHENLLKIKEILGSIDLGWPTDENP